MLLTKKHDPWFYAEKAERKYITPEDVGDAYRAGASSITTHAIVLKAIADKRVEDVNCTAFVAVDIPTRPSRKRTTLTKGPAR